MSQKLKAIRDKKEVFFLRRDEAACGRISAEKLGLFPEKLAYYEGGDGLRVKPRTKISAPGSFAHAAVRSSKGARLTNNGCDCLPEK
jgi:hypothetical protein